MADGHGAYDLSGADSTFTQQDLEDLAALGEQAGTKASDGPQGTGVVAMFAVVIPENGIAVAIPSIADALRAYHGRPASVPEMKYACAHVAEEIGHSRAAQHLIQTQMQTAAAMQQAAMNQKIAEELSRKNHR